jgi:putative exporter of polyketide antibiotics
MRAEEADGRLESVLAASVSRPRWIWSHLLNAGLGALLLLLAFAVSMSVGAGAVLGDIPAQLASLIGAGLVQLPAILVLAGVVGAFTGFLPRAAGALSWALLLLSILLGPMFGVAMLQLPAKPAPRITTCFIAVTTITRRRGASTSSPALRAGLVREGHRSARGDAAGRSLAERGDARRGRREYH